MTIELKMLALSIVLGLVRIVLSAQSKNLQHGYRWAAGPRDVPRPQLTGIAGARDVPAVRRRRVLSLTRQGSMIG
jgi:uncharacterized MAPEG superfamily protein